MSVCGHLYLSVCMYVCVGWVTPGVCFNEFIYKKNTNSHFMEGLQYAGQRAMSSANLIFATTLCNKRLCSFFNSNVGVLLKPVCELRFSEAKQTIKCHTGREWHKMRNP